MTLYIPLFSYIHIITKPVKINFDSKKEGILTILSFLVWERVVATRNFSWSELGELLPEIKTLLADD